MNKLHKQDKLNNLTPTSQKEQYESAVKKAREDVLNDLKKYEAKYQLENEAENNAPEKKLIDQTVKNSMKLLAQYFKMDYFTHNHLQTFKNLNDLQKDHEAKINSIDRQVIKQANITDTNNLDNAFKQFKKNNDNKEKNKKIKDKQLQLPKIYLKKKKLLSKKNKKIIISNGLVTKNNKTNIVTKVATNQAKLDRLKQQNDLNISNNIWLNNDLPNEANQNNKSDQSQKTTNHHPPYLPAPKEDIDIDEI